MADSADVRDLETLQEFESFLGRFRETLTNRSDEVRVQMSRVTAWVTSESPAYWRHETLKAEQRYSEARMALALCRAKVREEDHEACTDQQRQVDIWKRRLELCQTRNQQLIKALQEWEQFIQESRSSISGLADLADTELIQARLDIQRTIDVLTRYTEKQ